MDQRGGLQRVRLAFVFHVPAGHAAQFRIDLLRQPIERSFVTAAPGPQQMRDFSRGFLDGRPVLPIGHKNISRRRGRFCRPLPPVTVKRSSAYENQNEIPDLRVNRGDDSDGGACRAGGGTDPASARISRVRSKGATPSRRAPPQYCSHNRHGNWHPSGSILIDPGSYGNVGTSLPPGRPSGSPPMETASIRQLSGRRNCRTYRVAEGHGNSHHYWWDGSIHGSPGELYRGPHPHLVPLPVTSKHTTSSAHSRDDYFPGQSSLSTANGRREKRRRTRVNCRGVRSTFLGGTPGLGGRRGSGPKTHGSSKRRPL